MVRGSATPAAIEGLSTVTEVDAGSAAPAVTVMVFALVYAFSYTKFSTFYHIIKRKCYHILHTSLGF